MQLRRIKNRPTRRSRRSLLQSRRKATARPTALEQQRQLASASLVDVVEKYGLHQRHSSVPCPAIMSFFQYLRLNSSNSSRRGFTSSSSESNPLSLSSSELPFAAFQNPQQLEANRQGAVRDISYFDDAFLLKLLPWCQQASFSNGPMASR